jgi:Zn-dependent protease
MNQPSISLGRIFGIRIGLDYSWFLIFALLTWTLAANYFPNEFKGWPTAEYWIIGALTALMLFVCVLLHELGHALVARRYKIPVRNITLMIFGGVAQLGAEPVNAAAEFWIALAGPLVSFALAALFGLLQPLVAGAGWLLALARYLAYINGALALFNLIPGFPLDGGQVFRAVVWAFTHNARRATLIAANVGRFIAFISILIGVGLIFNGNLSNGLWTVFIGWFLESAAASQVQHQRLQDLLAGHKASEAMRQNYAVIPADTTLQQLVDHHILGSGQRSLVVEQGENVVGLVTPHRIQDVPRTEWPTTTVGQIMMPVGQLKQVRPDAELWDALELMDHNGVNQVPVMDDQHILGMLSRDGIIGLLRTLREPSLQTR